MDIYPTTPLQTSFLMANLMVNDAYIVRQAWDLPPGTDSIKLQQTFEDYIDHPNGAILRTIFVLEPASNQWLQVLIRPGGKRMEWINVIVEDEAELEERITEYQHTRAIEHFAEGELLTRACVFQINEHARVLVWSLHHALVDHRTLDSIMSDVEYVYTNRPLPPRRPFKTMVRYLHGLNRANSLEFWQKHLHDASPTAFPQRRPETARATANAAAQREVCLKYNLLSRRFGIMVSTLATLAWSVVLSVHTNSMDVVFGQVLGGRCGTFLFPCLESV